MFLIDNFRKFPKKGKRGEIVTCTRVTYTRQALYAKIIKISNARFDGMEVTQAPTSNYFHGSTALGNYRNVAVAVGDNTGVGNCKIEKLVGRSGLHNVNLLDINTVRDLI